MEIYLDNSSTTRAYKCVGDAVRDVMCNHYGNPSSLHRKGIEAEKLIKQSKIRIADTLRADPREIFFTSGGTESNNLAIFGAAGAGHGKHIISTPIEHPATLNALKVLEDEGYRVDYLPVNSCGEVSVEDVKNLVCDETVLITLMLVNNEIGTIQPAGEISRVAKEINPNVPVHVDAVQGYCKIPFTAASIGADMISISGHKIHGSKGVGALYIKHKTRLVPQLHGGGQQGGIRPGTENVPGIVGLGVAAERCHSKMSESVPQMAGLRKRLEEGLRKNISGIKINTPERCAPHILNVSFADVRAEVLLHSLESEGIYVSSGSACSSHKKDPSYVLKSIGVDKKMIDGSIRFSLCEFNTESEIDYVIEKTVKIVARLRKLNI